MHSQGPRLEGGGSQGLRTVAWGHTSKGRGARVEVRHGSFTKAGAAALSVWFGFPWEYWHNAGTKKKMEFSCLTLLAVARAIYC